MEDRTRYFALSSEETSALRETLIDAGWFVTGPGNPAGRVEMRAPGEPTWAETEFTPYDGTGMNQKPILPHGVVVEIPCG